MYTQLQLRDAARPPVNLSTLNRMREEHEPIAALTCYDASFAVLLDQGGVDLVLVGDSLGMVIQGHDTTVPVTVDDMVYHTRAVARGTYRPFLVAYLERIRPRWPSPSTTTWPMHSRRIEPVTRSTKGFCQGVRGAVGASSIWSALTCR
jgi:hypothetical protein